jgi:ATP phosphoribosyltransferase regulatory subunit
MVTLALSVLEKLGITGCRVSLGHPGIFEALLEGVQLPEPAIRELRDALARRDRAELMTLAKGLLAPKAIRRLEVLLDSIGQAEVLARARERLALESGGKLADAVDRLAAIYKRVEAAGYGSALLIDLGEVRGFDYYTGMVFDLFVEGVGYEIGGGGRYDQLIGRFGADRPSTGFALYATPLLQIMTRQQPSSGGGQDRAPRGGGRGH